ncbi:MAG: HAD-IG family 5'-nucleotidase [Nannocystaceae bacterium]
MSGRDLPLLIRKHLLAAGVAAEAPYARRVFTNRDLAFESMGAVGFDMDYTLGVYNQPALEALSIEICVKKLLAKGHPCRLGAIKPDPEFAIRGLVVDKEHGNVLKMDRHGYVGNAYHGWSQLARPERKALYRAQRVGQEKQRFARVDTLFALPEVTLFASMVDFIEKYPADWKGGVPSFREVWQDVREVIDEAHRDDTIKSRIKAEPEKYFHKDPDLAATLHKLRSAGKKLFLLTNSFFQYTDAVLSYLLNDELKIYEDWTRYFHWIIVGSSKPGFFATEEPFVEIDRRTAVRGKAQDRPQKGRIYQGGNRQGLEAAMGVHSDEVLYVGDHIYGDIVASKKTSSWRTVLVVDDLEHELDVQRGYELSLREIEALAELRNELTEQAFAEKYRLRVLERLDAVGITVEGRDSEAAAQVLGETILQSRTRLERLQSHREEMGSRLDRRTGEVDRAFNRYWGSVFTERLNTSLFGSQVEDYACLYTSRVSNFLYVSPSRYFHAPHGRMPHQHVR